MAQTKQLLAVRAKSNARKPDFVVKESRYVTRIKKRWRFMHGRHSKVRQMHCGRPALPTPGYGAPAEVRGMHRSGLMPVVVATEKQLFALNPAHQGAVLASKLGARKRVVLMTLASQKNISLLNVKDAKVVVDKIAADLARRRKARSTRSSSKVKKDEEKRRSAEEKKASDKKEAADKKAGSAKTDAARADKTQDTKVQDVKEGTHTHESHPHMSDGNEHPSVHTHQEHAPGHEHKH